MTRFLRTFFGTKPVVGQKYIEDTPDPFAKKYIVEVVAVQDGYVKYKTLNSYFSDSSCETSAFRFNYKLMKD